MATSAFLLAMGSIGEVPAQTSDWPCVQRLVPEILAGQIWSGPALEGAQAASEQEGLVATLVDPRKPVEEVRAAVADYAASVPEAEREQALVALFKASLQAINDRRSDLIEGIQRYGRRQRALAEQIAAETRELEQARRDGTAPPERIADLEQAQSWDTRVFADRQRSLTLVCDQPVLLEQRAFALAQIIQGELK